MTERQRKLRLARKRALDEIGPDIRKNLCGKKDDIRGRPRKPNSAGTTENELLKTITELAISGSASDYRRRTEIIRTVKTLDDLIDELHNLGYQISRSAVCLRLLPRKSLSIEGKRHVKAAPVKSIRAQNTQHRNHPYTICKIVNTELGRDCVVTWSRRSCFPQPGCNIKDKK